MSFIKQLEKKVIGKINAIENANTKEDGIKIIKEANLNEKINRLGEYDEALGLELLTRYHEAVTSNSKK